VPNQFLGFLVKTNPTFLLSLFQPPKVTKDFPVNLKPKKKNQFPISNSPLVSLVPWEPKILGPKLEPFS